MKDEKRKRRILVIDDNTSVLNAISAALAGAGYDVVATDQTVGAGRHLKGSDLVIIDYHMPGFDGRDVVQSLRAAAAKLEVTPVFYLYTSDLQLEIDAKKLGFDGVFTQKGNATGLLQQVGAALRMIDLAARKNR